MSACSRWQPSEASRGLPPQICTSMQYSLVADTHGVFDPVAASLLKGAQLILHAGDVGHHGTHAEVLKAFSEATHVPIFAVRGNVDEGPGLAQVLPAHSVLDANGWRLLLLHVVAPGPTSKIDASAAALIKQHDPDIVVFGHSHKAAYWQSGRTHFINPGSAGPARFKLKRTVARLWLPPKPHDQACTLQLVLRPQQPAQQAAAATTGEQGMHAQQQAALPEEVCEGWLQVLELPAKAPARLKPKKPCCTQDMLQVDTAVET